MSDALTPESVQALLDGATPGPWDDVEPSVGAPGTRLLLAPWTTDGGEKHRPHVMDEQAWRRIVPGNRALIAAAPDLACALLAAWRERDNARAEALRLVCLHVAGLEAEHDGDGSVYFDWLCRHVDEVRASLLQLAGELEKGKKKGRR